MVRLISLFALLALSAAIAHANPPTTAPATQPTSVLAFTVNDIDGKPVDLASYKGKVLLIVNGASKCGFTAQYQGLEKIYQQYKDRDFAVLAFPANDFKGQEPGTDAQIKEFCSSKYNVTFNLFSKISVAKGENQAPLYQYLTDPAKTGKFGGPIAWNFTKFLVAKDGTVVNRFEPKVAPTAENVTAAIEAELGK